LAYDLVATSGPVEGERFSLDSSQETLIGRTRNGINLPDPLVSVKHARVEFVNGGWRITDLGSATGTKVNGTPLDPDRPMPLELGDTIVIGECEFILDSSGARVLSRLAWAIIPAWVLVFVSFGVLFWVSGEGPVVLTWSEPIRTTEGASKRLEIPATFIRQHGLQVESMRLRRITDFDGNEIDELWFYVGDDEMVITFTETGWKLLGELPKGCIDRQTDEPFPDLACEGLEFRMYDGEYIAVAQTDPVVWLVGEAATITTDAPDGDGESTENPAPTPVEQPPSTPEGEPLPLEIPELAAVNGAAGPVPFRISMGSVDRLAGFLAQHGVTGPIHYVICEDAFPGVPAQALLENGRVQLFSYGCAQEVHFAGDRASAFEGTRIGAFAVTEIGREMLTRHLSYTWSGTPQRIFLSADKRSVIDAASQWPIPIRGGVYMTFEASDHVFLPIARSPRLDDRIRLEALERVDLDGQVATLLSKGTLQLDPDGCSDIQVRVRKWRCAFARGCFPRSNFITVDDVGCGSQQRLLDVPYAPGQYRGSNDQVEVRVELMTESQGLGVTDVIQARVGVRARP
jgi:hypothetical protein